MRRKYRRRNRRRGFRHGGLLLGLLIGMAGTGTYFMAIEGSSPDALINLVRGEPPTQAQVQRRAEALMNRAGLTVLGSAFCPRASTLTVEWEAKLECKYPFVDFLNPTANADTRATWQNMDELKAFPDELERTCL